MSETWLKDNQKLLDCVDIPGYNLEAINEEVVLEFVSKKHLPTQNVKTS